MENSEEKKHFLRHLQEFWTHKGVNNLKIPQIGGRELDLHHLYKSVCARGGAQFVSTNKLWKDIVSEFGLPPSCTSASFTLRNHYQKYLLSYEQKFLFGKDDQQAVRQLVGSRQRKPTKLHGGNISNLGDDQDIDGIPGMGVGGGLGGIGQAGGIVGGTSTSQIDMARNSKSPFLNQQSQINQNSTFNSQMKGMYQFQRNTGADMYSQSPNGKQDFRKSPHSNNMVNQLWDKYNKNFVNDEIYFTKKNKIVPTMNEMKRIMLAFESHLQEEILYALNSILLYSFNTWYPLLFDYYPELLNNMANYLEYIINNTPYISKQLVKKQQIQFSQVPQQSSQPYTTTTTLNQIQNNANNTTSTIKLNIIDNYNYSIVDILQSNQESPIKLLYQNQDNQIQMKYDMASELELLEQIRTILQILRNASFVKPNELTIFKNEKVFNIILKLFINVTDKEIQKNTLDLISNISKNIFINNLNPEITTPKEFCNKLAEFLMLMSDINQCNSGQNNQNEQIEAAIDAFRKLVIIQENEIILETILYQNLESFVKLLVSPSFEIREGVLELLCFLSDLKMSTRLGIAKQPRCIMRLIALMSSGTLKNNQKTSKLCALILNNISLAPASKFYFLPYERDLFLIAATDDQVSKIISNVLGDLDNLVTEDYEEEVIEDAVESLGEIENGEGLDNEVDSKQNENLQQVNNNHDNNIYSNNENEMNIETENNNLDSQQNNDNFNMEIESNIKPDNQNLDNKQDQQQNIQINNQ